MIAIVNYDTGNIRSVINALARTGCTDWVYTDDKEVLSKADKVILPGVGEASSAMVKLSERGLDTFIPTLTQPVLGICVGTQLMCESSEEGDTVGMGIFRTKVRRFNPTTIQDDLLSSLKVPHMGWNQIGNLETKLFKGLEGGSYVYFVHSYYPELCPDTIATARHGVMFSAALKYENFYGTQFHPEKSGDVGERIIENFLKL